MSRKTLEQLRYEKNQDLSKVLWCVGLMSLIIFPPLGVLLILAAIIVGAL